MREEIKPIDFANSKTSYFVIITEMQIETGDLSIDEFATYRFLTDAYYELGETLPSDLERLSILIGCGSKKLIKKVLDKFFTLTDNGYVYRGLAHSSTEPDPETWGK